MTSLLIHCAVFALIIYFNKFNNNKLNSVTFKIHENMQLLFLVDHYDQKKQVIHDNNKKFNISKNLSPKNFRNSKIENNTIESFTNNKKIQEESVNNLNQNFGIENNFSQNNVNPFGIIKVPKKLLSQNLFPKKYYANFTLIKENDKIISYKFLGLTPTGKSYAYLDNSVQKAFYSQLQLISIEKVLFWLINQQNTQYSFETPRDSNHLAILLEFQEAN
ncbi:MAG: hypothetical protein DCC88_03500 [Spirobacillus cienkowskii]|jgi:hypothetical protein|uniref:Uncharacterized protein n=2 Tax=Spirobacillus cienkowskii TaxID=495820 RepID=A0A369KV88_9BACT|nr:MAG: hypothetical protein DCC88_03500 [Spirobacillus cienkowskii]